MPQALNVADLKITSDAFSAHKAIPEKHTGDGEDVSPALSFTGVPDGTKSFAVVVHDPDAPLVDGWTHWVAYNIAGDATGLAEGADVINGTTNFGEQKYNGPAPPPGHGPHHYYFWVYALDADLGLAPGLTRRELLDAIEDHVIEQARVIGTYEH